LPRKIFLVIGLNIKCVEIYIDLSTNEHDLALYIYHAIARRIKSFEYVVKVKIESKIFQFF
jgi:hypothetical protein